MVICIKNNGKPRRTTDFQSLNSHGTRETHHTQSTFHQAKSVPHGKCLMLGMVITVFHFILMIIIIPLSSPHEADTTIVLHFKNILPLGMVTQDTMMKLFHHFLRKPNVSMIRFFGQMTASFRQPGGLTFVDNMALLLIQISLCLLRIMWSLLDLRLQVTLFTLVTDILQLSWSFLSLKT